MITVQAVRLASGHLRVALPSGEKVDFPGLLEAIDTLPGYYFEIGDEA